MDDMSAGYAWEIDTFDVFDRVELSKGRAATAGVLAMIGFRRRRRRDRDSGMRQGPTARRRRLEGAAQPPWITSNSPSRTRSRRPLRQPRTLSRTSGEGA